jgi:ADP-ribose pyrophosphatase YjhB (NUDIX family)
MAETVHIVVRALFVHDDRVLVARFENRHYAFLPGGRVEFGESARAALVRELQEELGVACTVRRIVSVVEHAFEENGREQQEINLVFEARSEQLAYPERPVSREPGLSFDWQSIGAIDEVNLRPWPMRTILHEYISGEPVTPWMSTIEP